MCYTVQTANIKRKIIITFYGKKNAENKEKMTISLCISSNQAYAKKRSIYKQCTPKGRMCNGGRASITSSFFFQAVSLY